MSRIPCKHVPASIVGGISSTPMPRVAGLIGRRRLPSRARVPDRFIERSKELAPFQWPGRRVGDRGDQPWRHLHAIDLFRAVFTGFCGKILPMCARAKGPFSRFPVSPMTDAPIPQFITTFCAGMYPRTRFFRQTNENGPELNFLLRRGGAFRLHHRANVFGSMGGEVRVSDPQFTAA